MEGCDSCRDALDTVGWWWQLMGAATSSDLVVPTPFSEPAPFTSGQRVLLPPQLSDSSPRLLWKVVMVAWMLWTQCSGGGSWWGAATASDLMVPTPFSEGAPYTSGQRVLLPPHLYDLSLDCCGRL